jgi:hypothetical protein
MKKQMVSTTEQSFVPDRVYAEPDLLPSQRQIVRFRDQMQELKHINDKI